MNRKEALSKIRAICSRQEQCRQDVRSRLAGWDISEKDSEQIIEILEQEGFIDHFRYASSFANDKFRFNKWGRIKIRWMLRQKGLSEDVIEKALSVIDEDEYMGILTSELMKKKKSIRIQDESQLKGKLISFGTQRGFEYEMIYQVLNKLLKE